MKKTRGIEKNNKSIVVCVFMGLLATVLVSLIMSVIITGMIQKGTLSENGNIGVFTTRVIATMMGSLLGAAMTRKNILFVIGVIAAGYYIVLLVLGLLFFDGSLDNVWQGFVSIIIGGCIACLIKLKPQRTRRKHIRFAR